MKQGIISTEQGILTQEQEILPAEPEIITGWGAQHAERQRRGSPGCRRMTIIVVRSAQLHAHAFQISRQPQDRRTGGRLPSRNRSQSREPYGAGDEVLCAVNNSAMREWTRRLSY